MFNPNDFDPYIDGFNLLTENAAMNFDGGDSAHRFGVAYVCLKTLDAYTWLDGKIPLDMYYDSAMTKYETDTTGEFRRHPDPTKWYSNPNNLSRDQAMMLEAAMVMAKDEGLASAVIDKLVKNKGFHQNTMRNYNEPGQKIPDFTTPSEIATLIRGTNNRILYPLLVLLDGFFLVDIFLAVVDDGISKSKGKRTDAYTMLITNLLVANQHMRTPFSWLAGKLVKLTDFKGAIQWIFKPENNDPPLDKLLLPAAEKVL